MAEVVTPYECEHLVASLQPLSVEEAGAEAWVAQAGAVERLSVGAVLQSAGGETEAVARLLADTEDKVSCDWLAQVSILSSDWSGGRARTAAGRAGDLARVRAAQAAAHTRAPLILPRLLRPVPRGVLPQVAAYLQSLYIYDICNIYI